MSDYDNDRISAKEAIDLLRVQKHDFLNYMQIISGYLQLGKYDKAQHFLQKALRDISRSGTIMGLADPVLGMNLLLRVHNAYREYGVDISLSATTDLQLMGGPVFNQFMDKVMSAIEEVYAEILGQVQILIDFSEDEQQYCMDLSVLPFESGAFFCLTEKVKEASVGLDSTMTIKSLPETNSMGFQICFSKNTRSG